MTLDFFQVLCVPVLVFAYAMLLRSAGPLASRRAGEAVVLAVAGCLGEHTCIEWYAFYHYADGWWLPVGHVPLWVPLIWPMVILSARQVCTTLWPTESRFKRALQLAAVVVFDATIMEVIAVGAGYWSWAEGGYLSVPIMGILGWGCFAFGASFWLDRSDRERSPLEWLLAPVVLAAAAHAVILAVWWVALRWGLRGDQGVAATVVFGGLSLLYTVYVLRSGRRMGPQLVWPRVAATSVFLALLASLEGPAVAGLWLHVGMTAVPYLAGSDWRAMLSFGMSSREG